MRFIPLPPDRIQWLCMDEQSIYVFGLSHVYSTPMAGGDQFVKHVFPSAYTPARRAFPNNHWRACLEFTDRIVMASAKPLLMEINRENKTVRYYLPVSRPQGMIESVWADTVRGGAGRLLYWNDVHKDAKADPTYLRTRMCGRAVRPLPDGNPSREIQDQFHTPLKWWGEKADGRESQIVFHREAICEDEAGGTKAEAVSTEEFSARCLLRINGKSVLEQPDRKSIASVTVSPDGLVVGVLLRKKGVVLWDVD